MREEDLFSSYTYVEGKTGTGQLLEFTCKPGDTEEIKRTLSGKVRTINPPITGMVNIPHGCYGRYTRFNITQHGYGGSDAESTGQGYWEALEIHNSPDGRCGFVVHIYSTLKGSIFYEFSTLECLEKAWEKSGINISVNILQNRVSGMWNYQTQNYKSSLYEMETDVNRIIKFAERGGRYPRGWWESDQKADIKLGTPEKSYVKIWRYKDNQSTELLVPALVFPATEKPKDASFWMNNVVVPLSKELLDEAEKQYSDFEDEPRSLPEPAPMPMEDVEDLSDDE